MDSKRNDWGDLEVFEHTGAKIGYPYVTISSRKTITLSAGFLHQAKNQILNNTHVILSFSKSKNAIVFSFTNDVKSPGATKITMKGNATIAARSFFNYYRIDSDKFEGKYIAKIEYIPGRDKSWVLYLNEKLDADN